MGHMPHITERGRSNRFLATLPPHDFALLTPHLRTVTLERGTILHDAGDEIERVYFLHSGMVSLVAVLQSGAAVETATIGRAGVIGASAGLGVKYSFGRAIVQLPGTAAWLSASQFHAAANGSQAIRDLIVHYSGMLLAQVQQSVACNVLHTMEARLCRWLLQAHDCMDGNDIPLTQEFLGQMLGVRRTTVTLAAQLLLTAGLFAPVEILVTEAEDGQGTTITYVRPSSLMVLGNNPPLMQAAVELDKKLDELISAVVASGESHE